MISFVLFLLELFFLFFISRLLTRALSSFIFRATNNQRLTVNLLSFLFLPGVILHELSHFLVARLLFVYTGEIEFLPVINHHPGEATTSIGSDSISRHGGFQNDNLEVKLGSVAIAHTDPLRRFLIGIAPLIVGVSVLLVVLSYSGQFLPSAVAEFFNLGALGKFAGLLYIVFEISATMFSSRKDMEGSMIIVVIVTIASLLLYALGVRVELSFIEQMFTPKVVEFFYRTDLFLLIPILINSGVLGILKSFRIRL